jgi:hypothetical protein
MAIKITHKDYEKMNNHHIKKNNDAMYNIDDYYYACSLLYNSNKDGKIFVAINLSGNSQIIVKRNKINDVMILVEIYDTNNASGEIKKFTKGYDKLELEFE